MVNQVRELEEELARLGTSWERVNQYNSATSFGSDNDISNFPEVFTNPVHLRDRFCGQKLAEDMLQALRETTQVPGYQTLPRKEKEQRILYALLLSACKSLDSLNCIPSRY